MNWLSDYRDDLMALQAAKDSVFPVDLTNEEQFRNFVDDFKTVFAPLEDGSLDPGDIDKVSNLWWHTFEINVAKKEVTILHCLAPFYQRLEHGTEEEWEEYVRLRIRARLNLLQALMQMLAKTRSTGQGNLPDNDNAL